MPSSETQEAADDRRHAEMTDPLHDAFPLPPTDGRFAELLSKLRGIYSPVIVPTTGPQPSGPPCALS